MIEMACCPAIARPQMTTGEPCREAANIPSGSLGQHTIRALQSPHLEKGAYPPAVAGERNGRAGARNHGQGGKLLIWKGQNFRPCRSECVGMFLIIEVVSA